MPRRRIVRKGAEIGVELFLLVCVAAFCLALTKRIDPPAKGKDCCAAQAPATTSTTLIKAR